jgi:DNA-binding NarL/FixJ family response regulator
VELFHTAGRPLFEGYAWEHAAVLLAGDRQFPAARRALAGAIDRYEHLGAAWDLDRATTRLASLGVRRTRRVVPQRPTTGWEALTGTERRVAALVAQGRSNPDIGTELLLSRRTAQNHVSHILAKLGLSSRVELAIAVAQRADRAGQDGSTESAGG